jgi:ADP-heptose:LPS heptosyltransferase
MLSEAELARGDDVISGFGGRSYVAFNMGGKAKEKDWGISNWEQLRDLLQPVCRGGAMVVGAAEDHGRAEEFLSRWNVGPTINVCGSLSPREAGAAMRKASLFVGHDSGPLHLACSVGCPSVGLFGNYNRPKQWHPISSHVRILHEMSGLERIAPEAVLKEAREIVVQGG